MGIAAALVADAHTVAQADPLAVIFSTPPQDRNRKSSSRSRSGRGCVPRVRLRSKPGAAAGLARSVEVFVRLRGEHLLDLLELEVEGDEAHLVGVGEHLAEGGDEDEEQRDVHALLDFAEVDRLDEAAARTMASRCARCVSLLYKLLHYAHAIR